MTGPDHYRAAELQQHARAVMDATQGPLAELSPKERAQLREADLADAQIHATLALAAAIGLSAGLRAPGRRPRHQLSLNAADFFAVASRWADRWVGSNGPEPEHNCTGPAGPAT